MAALPRHLSPGAAAPFTDLRVRVRQDPLGFFANMPEGFDSWSGIFGQYARGWTPMPHGAIALTEVGPKDDPRPADWLWRYTRAGVHGGWVVMRTGDNLIRYPDHGPHTGALVRDIAAGLVAASEAPAHPQARAASV